MLFYNEEFFLKTKIQRRIVALCKYRIEERQRYVYSIWETIDWLRPTSKYLINKR